MRTFKIILGALLLISSVVTMSQIEGGAAHGAGLAGSMTGFSLIAWLSLWLIYSGSNSDKEK